MEKVEWKSIDGKWVRFVNGDPVESEAVWYDLHHLHCPPEKEKEIIKDKKYYKNHPEEDYVEDITYIYCELGKNCPNDDIFLGCVKTEKYHYVSGKVKQEQTCDYQVIKSIYNIN